MLLFAAATCLDAGAHGITVHPRPDERHIRPQDVHDLSALLHRDWPAAEFNIEGNPFHNLMDFVRELRPHQATFVPDSEPQSTSDHGWSFPEDADRLRPVIAEARSLGVRVSLFMDPDASMMAAAKAVGADRVELYTEGYAASRDTSKADAVLQLYVEAARAAQAAGLEVNAGHDLSRENLSEFLRAVPSVREVSIGHAFVSDALELGYRAATREYLRRIDEATVIYGIGTDICDVRRIAATLRAPGRSIRAESPGATPSTQPGRRAAPAGLNRGLRYLATRFSAKEAFRKAIGMGMRMPMSWRNCEIANLKSGKPVIVLHGPLKDWFEGQGLSAHVTVVTDENRLRGELRRRRAQGMNGQITTCPADHRCRGNRTQRRRPPPSRRSAGRRCDSLRAELARPRSDGRPECRDQGLAATDIPDLRGP